MDHSGRYEPVWVHHVTTRVAAAAYAGCAPFEDHVTLTQHRIGSNRLVASSAVHCKTKKRSASQLAGDVSKSPLAPPRPPPPRAVVYRFSLRVESTKTGSSLCVCTSFLSTASWQLGAYSGLFVLLRFFPHSVFMGSALRFASFPPTKSTCLCLCYALSRRQFFFLLFFVPRWL